MQCFIDGSLCDKNPSKGFSILNAGVCKLCHKISSNEDAIGRFLKEVGLRDSSDDLVTEKDLQNIAINSEDLAVILLALDKFIDCKIKILVDKLNDFKDMSSVKEFMRREEWWLSPVLNEDIECILVNWEIDTKMSLSTALSFLRNKLKGIENGEWSILKQHINFLEKFF